MRPWLAIRLALADLRFERFSALCQVIGLAALLLPLLILLGIKDGILADRTRALLGNPESLRLSISRTGQYPRALIERLAADPDVGFVAPHPAQLAVVANFSGLAAAAPAVSRVTLLATGPGDPYLPDGAAPPARGEAYLSAALAGGLKVAPGDSVLALLPPRPGEPGGARFSFRVAGLVPAGRWGRTGALLHPDDLFLIQDWTEGQVSGGDLDTLRGRPSLRDSYPSLRLYAAGIDGAFRLVDRLAAEGVPVAASLEQAREIARLDQALTAGFRIVAGVGLAGHALAFGASLWNGVSRKRRVLSLLRLGGLGRSGAAIMPMVQGLAIALLGWAMAMLLYWASAGLLDRLLGRAMMLEAPLTRLAAGHVASSAVAALAVGLLASAWAAVAVMRITLEEGVADARQ